MLNLKYMYMRKILSCFSMIAMLLAFVANTSCSTAKSVNSSFVKNGYTMTSLTPAQQVEIAPVLNAFPAFDQNAIGYIKTGDATTFVYAVDEVVWNSYGSKLEAAGFSNMGKGFVKANKNAGVTYNVSSKFTTIYKQTYLLVTYTYSKF